MPATSSQMVFPAPQPKGRLAVIDQCRSSLSWTPAHGEAEWGRRGPPAERKLSDVNLDMPFGMCAFLEENDFTGAVPGPRRHPVTASMTIAPSRISIVSSMK